MTLPRSFTVEAKWDPDAKVWVAETDIIGLALEAETLDEFESALGELAIECIVTNHWAGRVPADLPLSQVIPTVVWKRPAPEAA